MSVQQNPATRQSFAVPANLNRLLLLCRFDFRQKTWGLPALENRRDCDFIFPANSAALTSAVGKSLKAAIRHSLRRPWVNPQHGSDKSETFIFAAGQHFKPKEPRRGRRNLSAARVANLATNF
jgi:hypothetical protein